MTNKQTKIGKRRSGQNCKWVIRGKYQRSQIFTYFLETASYCQYDAWQKYPPEKQVGWCAYECVQIDLDLGVINIGKWHKVPRRFK